MAGSPQYHEPLLIFRDEGELEFAVSEIGESHLPRVSQYEYEVAPGACYDRFRKVVIAGLDDLTHGGG